MSSQNEEEMSEGSRTQIQKELNLLLEELYTKIQKEAEAKRCELVNELAFPAQKKKERFTDFIKKKEEQLASLRPLSEEQKEYLNNIVSQAAKEFDQQEPPPLGQAIESALSRLEQKGEQLAAQDLTKKERKKALGKEYGTIMQELKERYELKKRDRWALWRAKRKAAKLPPDLYVEIQKELEAEKSDLVEEMAYSAPKKEELFKKLVEKRKDQLASEQPISEEQERYFSKLISQAAKEFEQQEKERPTYIKFGHAKKARIYEREKDICYNPFSRKRTRFPLSWLGKEDVESKLDRLEEKIESLEEKIAKAEAKGKEPRLKKVKLRRKNREHNRLLKKLVAAHGGLELTPYNDEIYDAYKALNAKLDILATKLGALRYGGEELSSYAPVREFDWWFGEQKQKLRQEHPDLYREYLDRKESYERVQGLVNLGVELIKEANDLDKPHLTIDDVKACLDASNIEQSKKQAEWRLSLLKQEEYTPEKYMKEEHGVNLEVSFDRLPKHLQLLIRNGWADEQGKKIKGYDEKRQEKVVEVEKLERRAERLQRMSQALDRLYDLDERDLRFLSELTQLDSAIKAFRQALPENYEGVRFSDTFLTQDFFSLLWDYSRYVLRSQPYVRGGLEEGLASNVFDPHSYVEVPLAYVNGLLTDRAKELREIAESVHEKHEAQSPQPNKLHQALKDEGGVLGMVGHLIGRAKKDEGAVSLNERISYAIDYLLNYEGVVPKRELNETFNGLEALRNIKELPVKMSGNYWSLLEESVRRAIGHSRNINNRLGQLVYNEEKGLALDAIIGERASREAQRSLKNAVSNAVVDYLEEEKAAEEPSESQELLPEPPLHTEQRGPKRVRVSLPERTDTDNYSPLPRGPKRVRVNYPAH